MRRTERGQDDNRYARRVARRRLTLLRRVRSKSRRHRGRRGVAGRPNHLVNPELPNQGAGDILVEPAGLVKAQGVAEQLEELGVRAASAILNELAFFPELRQLPAEVLQPDQMGREVWMGVDHVRGRRRQRERQLLDAGSHRGAQQEQPYGDRQYPLQCGGFIVLVDHRERISLEKTQPLAERPPR